MRVGIEIGGTFTDLIAIEEGKVRVAKVPSVPQNPEQGVFSALEAANISLDEVTDLVHGSTVATNAVLERKGALSAFIVTKGFRDLLLIQRQHRTKIFDIAYRKPEPIIERRDTFEVPERVLADGTIETSLDAAALENDLVEFLSARPYRAVAICLLNAYANSAHEEAIAALIRRRLPNLRVSCSFEVSREFREYERASTTALSAYVQPVIDSYVGKLEEKLTQGGFSGHFSIMQSNGGRIPAAAIRRNAITALFSGPAAGVRGAVRQAEVAGHRNIITFDMGGTSTDVCLVANGKPSISAETSIDGLPIRTPVIDIATVGAGGGSIVWRDPGGMLRVGPKSSGADPGPACYGRGGREPTITDAHALRGLIPADSFLGGRMRLDVAASRKVFQPLAEEFGMSPEQLADSAIKIANSNVVRAIQLISTELGRDPRDYALIPFGGAGPLHAVAIAEELGIRKIIVPPHAGVLSAYGLLASEFAQFETLTRRIPVVPDVEATIQLTFGEMAAALIEKFRSSGIRSALSFTYILQMRFVGQAFELDVPLEERELATLDAEGLRNRFGDAYRQVYFQGGELSLKGRRIEIVSFRLGASAWAGNFDLPVESDDPDAPTRAHKIFSDGQWWECSISTRAHATGRGGLAGPVLIEDGTSTIYIPTGWHGQNDRSGNLIIAREGH